MADQMTLADELLSGDPQIAQSTNSTSVPMTMTSAEPQTPRAATGLSTPTDQAPLGALISDAVEADPAFLSLLADIVDDTERVRIANENRLRQLTRVGVDKDGETRGLGLDIRNPQVEQVALLVAKMKCDSDVLKELGFEKPRKSKGCCLECDAIRSLEALMKKHPLGPWVESQKGVGLKQGARLLGAIGDPYMRPELVHTDADGNITDVEPARPRLVSELWSYCGLSVEGGAAVRRQKGRRANWSTVAKTRAYLIAKTCMKTIRKPCVSDKELGTIHADGCDCSPFRHVYDQARAKYANAVHNVPCQVCGGKNKPPAPVGTPLKDGHKHARALRTASKEVLRELWRESKRLHDTGNW